jgi:hypothetical protein
MTVPTEVVLSYIDHLEEESYVRAAVAEHSLRDLIAAVVQVLDTLQSEDVTRAGLFVRDLCIGVLGSDPRLHQPRSMAFDRREPLRIYVLRFRFDRGHLRDRHLSCRSLQGGAYVVRSALDHRCLMLSRPNRRFIPGSFRTRPMTRLEAIYGLQRTPSPSPGFGSLRASRLTRNSPCQNTSFKSSDCSEL